MALSAAEVRFRDRNNPRRIKRNATLSEREARGRRNRDRAALNLPTTKGNQGNPRKVAEAGHSGSGAKGSVKVQSHYANRSTRGQKGSVTKGAGKRNS